MIEQIFPTLIYKDNVPCPPEHWHSMIKFCEEFYAKNKEEIEDHGNFTGDQDIPCLLYTSPSPRDGTSSRMPSSA